MYRNSLRDQDMEIHQKDHVYYAVIVIFIGKYKCVNTLKIILDFLVSEEKNVNTNEYKKKNKNNDKTARDIAR